MPRTKATNMQLRQRVARRLRDARVAQNLSQEDLAEKLGVAPESVSRFERGRSPLSLELLGRASRVLGVPIEQLVGKGPAGLSTEETELVEAWRRLGAQGRRAVLEVLRLGCEVQAGRGKVG